jgi:hypothetical protein
MPPHRPQRVQFGVRSGLRRNLVHPVPDLWPALDQRQQRGGRIGPSAASGGGQVEHAVAEQGAETRRRIAGE